MESTKTYNKYYECWEWKNSQGQLHRENDLPAIEYVYGDKYWYVNGQPHRENDLPAIVYDNGDKFWYLNGQLHREGGPAIICADGSVEYWEYGVRIQSEEDRQRAERLEQEKKIAKLEEASTKI